MAPQGGPDQVPERVLGYLRESRTLTLATATGDGEPHAATLLYVNDGVELFVWLRGSSQTLRHVEANPRVAFAIDQYAEDWSRTRGVQGSGECGVVTGEDIARVAMLFGEKFPQLEPGGSTASIRFFRIRPSELQFIDNTGAERRTDEFGIDYHRDRVYPSGPDS